MKRIPRKLKKKIKYLALCTDICCSLSANIEIAIVKGLGGKFTKRFEKIIKTFDRYGYFSIESTEKFSKKKLGAILWEYKTILNVKNNLE